MTFGKQIDILQTPCGKVYIIDECGVRIPFTLRKNTYDCEYDCEDEAGKTKIISTDTNYNIVVDVSSLQLKKEYKVMFEGATLEFGGSDERAVCISGKANGYCIALGSHLPNDDERMEQAYEYSKKMGYLEHRTIQDPPEFDESKFVQYDADILDDYSGFRFHLVDFSRKEILFPIAWIKSEPEYEQHFQSAVEFWTT